jgi:adenylate cyclase
MPVQRTTAALAGLAAGLVALAFTQVSEWYANVREQSLDAITGRFSDIPADGQPIVIDIDRATLGRTQSRQMRRSLLSDVIVAAAKQHPRAIIFDVLIEGEDASSAGYLARSLAERVDDPAIERLAKQLPDDDTHLVEVAGSAPVVLGLALDPDESGPSLPIVPVLSRGHVDASEWWAASGLRGPAPPLAAAASGLGILALPGDADAAVRRVPLLAIGGNRAVPGLSLEAIRVEQQASTILVSGDTQSIAVGSRTIPLEADGMLRLVEGTPRQRAERSISAIELLQEAPPGKRLKDQLVLVGSSAPELGGLRTSIGGALVPSVQLHADAIAQMKAAVFPRRPAMIRMVELAVSAALAVGAIASGVLVSPVLGAGIALAASAAWIAAAVGLYISAHLLVDPLAGPVALIAAFTASAITTAAATRRRAAGLQRRFEQHLAPAVVKRILENPDLLKLDGERREVTSMFTDLEGFTAMTERAEPEALVALLDAYFERVSEIVVAHGGMIDKFVGDAVHALFNAPLDTPDHAMCAFRCAGAIVEFSREFEAAPQARALGLGRTRIGIETGAAIVGDVGGAGKLDYTAHGTVINTAARLEAANKELGSTVCIGPGAAARIPEGLMRPLGAIVLRGRSHPQMTYEPWPQNYSNASRTAYLTAFAMIDQSRSEAARKLQELSKDHPADQVVARLARQLGDQAPDALTRTAP